MKKALFSTALILTLILAMPAAFAKSYSIDALHIKAELPESYTAVSQTMTSAKTFAAVGLPEHTAAVSKMKADHIYLFGKDNKANITVTILGLRTDGADSIGALNPDGDKDDKKDIAKELAKGVKMDNAKTSEYTTKDAFYAVAEGTESVGGKKLPAIAYATVQNSQLIILKAITPDATSFNQAKADIKNLADGLTFTKKAPPTPKPGFFSGITGKIFFLVLLIIGSIVWKKYKQRKLQGGAPA